MTILGMDITLIFLIMILGFNTGVVSAFFGVSGSFLVTPSLNILGFPMVQAGATSIAFCTLSSTVAGFKHYMKNNLMIKVGIIIAIISSIGVRISQPLLVYMDSLNLADAFIRNIYIVMLVLLGIAPLLKNRNREHSNDSSKKSNIFLKYIQRSSNIDLAKGITYISLINMLIIGLLGGFIKVIMGVGGGFFFVPMFALLLNMKTHHAVGTSLLVIILSNLYAVYLHYLSANILLAPIVFLALMAYLGIKIGATAISNIEEHQLRIFYASFLIATAFGVLIMQLGFETIALLYNFSSITLVTTIIVIKYYFGINLIFNSFFKKLFIPYIKNNKTLRFYYNKLK
ncbi:sulfite exporter TauE/SafE family protein [Natronospora cellulosivora (SeqCode)]